MIFAILREFENSKKEKIEIFSNFLDKVYGCLEFDNLIILCFLVLSWNVLGANKFFLTRFGFWYFQGFENSKNGKKLWFLAISWTSYGCLESVNYRGCLSLTEALHNTKNMLLLCIRSVPMSPSIWLIQAFLALIDAWTQALSSGSSYLFVSQKLDA